MNTFAWHRFKEEGCIPYYSTWLLVGTVLFVFHSAHLTWSVFLCLPFCCRDHAGVSEAYEAMKKVASLINERKRRLESIDTIAHWQVSILRWEVRVTAYVGFTM